MRTSSRPTGDAAEQSYGVPMPSHVVKNRPGNRRHVVLVLTLAVICAQGTPTITSIERGKSSRAIRDAIAAEDWELAWKVGLDTFSRFKGARGPFGASDLLLLYQISTRTTDDSTCFASQTEFFLKESKDLVSRIARNELRESDAVYGFVIDTSSIIANGFVAQGKNQAAIELLADV